MDFVQDVCNADYFIKHWEHPKYPQVLQNTFYDNENRYSFNLMFTPQEQKKLIRCLLLLNVNIFLLFFPYLVKCNIIHIALD